MPSGQQEARSAPAQLRFTLKSIWQAARLEKLSLHLLILYVVFEYWKLQVIYPLLAVIPWGELTILGCSAAFVLCGEKGRRFHPLDVLFFAFAGWVYLTIPFAWDSGASMEAWQGMLTWVFMYFMVSHIVVTPRRLLLFWLAFMVVMFKMSQHGARTWIMRGFSFADWGASGSPVWFENSGEFAMGMAMMVPLSWCLLVGLRPHISNRLFWVGVALFPLTATMSVLASSSRGGQLALLVVVAMLVGASRVRWRALIISSFVIAVGWAAIPAEQKARFSSMGEDDTSQDRLTLWQFAPAIIEERPVFGVGYESWLDYYVERMGARQYESESAGTTRVLEMHNTYIEAAVELGIPGALMFYSLIISSFFVNRASRKRAKRLRSPWGAIMVQMATGLDLAMIALMIASFFMSVLFYPVYWMSLAMTVSLSATVRRTMKAVPAAHRAPTRRRRPAPGRLSPRTT